MPVIDWFNVVAREKHHLPDDWCWRSMDCHNMPDDYIKIGGCRPEGKFIRGPRKGQPKFPSKRDFYHIRFSEIEAAKLKWESENNLCHKCEGGGQEIYGHNVETGDKMRTCTRCGGNGKAIQTEKAR